MTIIRATQKLLNTQRIKPLDIDLQETKITTLGQWYANTVTSSFKGKSFVVYVHYESLITVITIGKTIKKTFPEFEKRLKNLLTRFSFPTEFVNEQLISFNEYQITKTNSRKMLGQMNGIIDQVITRMYSYENFEDIDLEDEENILMNYVHGNMPNKYFTPARYWNNYFMGEDPFKVEQLGVKEDEIIKLVLNENKLSRSENLHMENQLMKLQIEDILGGQIMSGSDMEIPTEIENMFLKNIIEFEKQAKNSKETSVFEMLGKPKLKLAADLTEKQIKTELNKVNLLLEKKLIHLDFLASYSDLVKYKFITEELVNHTTHTLNLPGMVTHFIYEEFHPNSEFEIKNHIRHFINGLLNNDLELSHFKFICTENFVLNNEQINLDELYEKVKLFQLLNNTDEVSNFKKKELEVNEGENKALVTGLLEFKRAGIKVKTKIPMEFKLVKSIDWWEISGLNFEMLN